MINIIPFKPKYRDDLIFMVLEAKNALGVFPRLNEDLLDIRAFYFDKGDMFWIAVDENDRVVGSIGYSSVENSSEVWLHRLYVKFSLKRKGIGSKLLETAESYILSKGKTCILVHLGKDFTESHSFYPKKGYREYKPLYMKKELFR